MLLSDSQQQQFSLQILLYCTTQLTNVVRDFLCCSLITKLTVKNRRTTWTKLAVFFPSCFTMYISASDKKRRRTKTVELESKKLQCSSTFIVQAVVSPCVEIRNICDIYLWYKIRSKMSNSLCELESNLISSFTSKGDQRTKWSI